MMSEEDKDKEFLTNSFKYAIRLAGALKTKDGELLPIVKFKEKGLGFYYSITDKSFVMINREEEWYFVPYVKEDELGRICIYSPYLFSMAIFIMVPPEELETVGYN
tara:strand:+ start:721 stop:1038 length:318 start_codon:yes stop_codon:yes gene_type:complete